MFSIGCKSASKQDVLKVITESQILSRYFNVHTVPILINSPLRDDKNASMGIYSPNGSDINYIDFGTNERGSIFTLLAKYWNVDYHEVFDRILREVSSNNTVINVCRVQASSGKIKSSTLDVTLREWRSYDIEWWNSYGITLQWLKYADVHPVSYIHITKQDKQYSFPADKLAYVYIERKEGRITKKVYQPLNTRGYKWCQDNDKSVLGLWRTLPKTGKMVVICSSVKDALTLICNCKVPAICMQGEGYSISNTVIKELQSRFNNIYVLLDNDKAGLLDAEKLCKETGFTNIILPQFKGGKDIADYRRFYGQAAFKNLMTDLLKLC